MRFKWIGFDGFYGDNPTFLRQLADNGEEFMGDIHKDHMIYYEDPKPIILPATSKKGKQSNKLQAQTRSMRVDTWVKKQSPGAWKRTAIRDSSKGKIFVDIFCTKLFGVGMARNLKPRRWHLVVRREIDSPEEIKYSLSNASLDTPSERLAFM